MLMLGSHLTSLVNTSGMRHLRQDDRQLDKILSKSKVHFILAAKQNCQREKGKEQQEVSPWILGYKDTELKKFVVSTNLAFSSAHNF